MAAVGAFHDLADVVADGADNLGRFSAAFSESLTERDVKPYPYRIPFHCSAECGRPIRPGDMCVQTSPGLRPLTRAHAACVAVRKGIEATAA